MFELLADCFGFFPLAAVFGLQPIPLSFGQGLVLQGHFQQALGGLRQGRVVRGDEVARRIGAGPEHEVGIVLGKSRSQPAGDNRGEPRVRPLAFFQHVLPAGGQGLCERLGRGVDRVDQRQQFALAAFVRLPAITPNRPDFIGGQRIAIDAQLVHHSLKTFPAIARPDKAGRPAASLDLAGSLQAADFLAVEIDSHPLAVERRCAVVPSAVKDLGRIDRRATFDVSAHVQAEGKVGAIVLKRKEHAVVAVLLAKDFAIAAQLGGGDPGAEGDLLDPLQVQIVLQTHGMVLRERQCVAEQPWHMLYCRGGLRVDRCIVAMAARIAADGAGGLIERPRGQQRLGDSLWGGFRFGRRRMTGRLDRPWLAVGRIARVRSTATAGRRSGSPRTDLNDALKSATWATLIAEIPN